MINRLVPPPIHHAVSFDLALEPAQRFTLSNGVPVIAVDAGVEEVLQLEWVFAAGTVFEPANTIAAATNFLLKNGTTSRTALQINEQIDFYGAFLNRQCYSETATITLHTLARHLPNLLPVVTDILTDSIFPQQEIELFVQNSKQKLSVNLRKCDFVANREIDSRLFGPEHPYGRYTTFEAFDAISREQLVQFYHNCYRQGEMAIFIAGKLPANWLEQLDEAFGNLPVRPLIPTATVALVPPLPAENQRIIRINNDEQGVQGAIRLARPFPNRHHPQFQQVSVLNTVFGGFFGSRLMSNIREDKGYTYGIHSFVQNNIGPCAWMITTEAGKEVCEATIKEVYHEMQLLRDELIDEEELLLVRNYLIGSILSSLDGPFQMIGRWKSYYLHGITDGEAYFNRAVETIKTVSAEELQALAQTWLQPETFYEMVVV